MALPANTALCDRKATFVSAPRGGGPVHGHRLMRRQLERLLGRTDPDPPQQPPLPTAPPLWWEVYAEKV